MIEIQHWGLIDYAEAWERQRELQTAIQRGERDSVLALCQHPSVITIGKNGTRDNVKLTDDELAERNISVISNNRGGDVTLHNPGQLVGYPIFRLTDFRADLHLFLREIEQCIIETIAEFSIESGRIDGLTGVWTGNEKICAIGIHCSRWVTSHGFALNICNDLTEFDFIVPCGITDKGISSMSSVLSQKISLEEVKGICVETFQKYF